LDGFDLAWWDRVWGDQDGADPGADQAVLDGVVDLEYGVGVGSVADGSGLDEQQRYGVDDGDPQRGSEGDEVGDGDGERGRVCRVHGEGRQSWPVGWVGGAAERRAVG